MAGEFLETLAHEREGGNSPDQIRHGGIDRLGPGQRFSQIIVAGSFDLFGEHGIAEPGLPREPCP